MKQLALLITLLATSTLTGCIEHKVDIDPIEVKPIHITMDVNVRVQIENDLSEFFDDEPTPTTTPKKK